MQSDEYYSCSIARHWLLKAGVLQKFSSPGLGQASRDYTVLSTMVSIVVSVRVTLEPH